MRLYHLSRSAPKNSRMTRSEGPVETDGAVVWGLWVLFLQDPRLCSDKYSQNFPTSDSSEPYQIRL
ncbi:hypothetical protein BCO19218_05985 [Burkholderia contaminans]|jgi:hypothetical protein|nr:hypothetical protein BCO19218_05985 [Burkholderia contaminans]